jgi:hypothetical protein
MIRRITKKIGTKKITARCLACNNCALSVVGYQKVFKLFWIPMFPLRKSTCVVCAFCGSTFPCELYSNTLSDIDLSFKTPWRYFSGLVILTIFVIVVSFLSVESDKAWIKDRETFLENPQPGTCFVFRFKEDSDFSIGKVEKVESGKILLRYSRQSHWEQGDAMMAAQVCLKNSKKCNLPNRLDVTLEELKHMEIDNIYFEKGAF